MKKVLSVVLGFILILGVFSFNPSSSSAAGNNQGVIDINNLDELEKTGEITIKEVTYDEMINTISSSKGITKAEAKKLHPNQMNQKTSRTSSEYSTSAISVQSTSLHEIKIRQQVVTNTYRPAVQLFVWTYNSGSFRQFNKIEEMDLDRKDITYSTSKQYQGKLRAEIQNGGDRIWWYINGDFYNNGTTTITGSVSASGVIWSGSGSISNASSHFKYWNNSGTYFAY